MKPEPREKILELWNKGYTKKEIAEMLGLNYSTLCSITSRMGLVDKKRGLSALSQEKRERVLEKIRKSKFKRMEQEVKVLENLLKERGPMFVKEAARALGWSVPKVKKYVSIFDDKFERFTISPFKRGRYPLNKLFKGGRIRLHIISLKGDGRIVEFFTSIIRKPVSRRKANAIARKLNPILGREITQEILEKLTRKKVKRTTQNKIK